MNKTRKEIECLAKLQKLGGNVDNILDFLLSESLVKSDEVKKIRSSPEINKDIQLLLANLSATGKFQLLEYEWVILPVERIKISIVTDRASHEFTYNH
jgi:hypothetical protein